MAPLHHGVAQDVSRPFAEHLEELRKRLIIVTAVLCIGSGGGYLIHRQLFAILRRPLNQQLYYTSPIGGFNAMLKISILFGILLSVPVIVYQLVRFLGPAFRKDVTAKPFRIVLLSVLLAAAGIAFAYFVSLPAALHWLTNLDTSGLQPFLIVDQYLNFVLYYLAGFALLFQLPLILILINRITPLSTGSLMKKQRWVILLSFIVAAILTPTPDPVNQTIMALPPIMLYQFSILFLKFRGQRPVSKPPSPQKYMDIKPAV